MKYTVEYTPTIMSGAVIRFNFGYDKGTIKDLFSSKDRTWFSCEISASRDGVHITGNTPVYGNEEDINQIKEILNIAQDLYKQMATSLNPHKIAKQFVDQHNKEVKKLANS